MSEVKESVRGNGRIWYRVWFDDDDDDVSERIIRSSRGLELIVRMARFHTEGRCVVNV